MITRKQRLDARADAREAWISANGDRSKAEDLFRESQRMKGLDPSTILQLLMIAFQLWQWWKERKKSRPESEIEEGEPIDYGTE